MKGMFKSMLSVVVTFSLTVDESSIFSRLTCSCFLHRYMTFLHRDKCFLHRYENLT